jgi:LDH2 family malate/lactate/ureidoglycolate dehydrogenase
MPAELFEERMKAFTDEIKSQPLAQGLDEIFYSGEIERRHEQKNLPAGFQLPRDTWTDLERIAAEIGLSDALGASSAI